jgi:hypothetical protein
MTNEMSNLHVYGCHPGEAEHANKPCGIIATEINVSPLTCQNTWFTGHEGALTGPKQYLIKSWLIVMSCSELVTGAGQPPATVTSSIFRSKIHYSNIAATVCITNARLDCVTA